MKNHLLKRNQTFVVLNLFIYFKKNDFIVGIGNFQDPYDFYESSKILESHKVPNDCHSFFFFLWLKI